MSQLIASTATRAATVRDHDGHGHDDARTTRSWVWALAEAVTYAGAFIDPTGVLAIQRLRQAQEEQDHATR
jgi:hypothetical protein